MSATLQRWKPEPGHTTTDVVNWAFAGGKKRRKGRKQERKRERRKDKERQR